MMKTMKTGIAGVMMALVAGLSLAQQGGFDKTAILRELDKLERVHKEKINVEQKGIGEEFEKALTSPNALMDLYEEAVFATKFDGAKKDSADFKKWKNNQEATLKDDAFQAALQIHVNYLYLTLRRAAGEDVVKLNEALIQHIHKVWALEGKFDLHKKQTIDLLDRPVTQGVLARRYSLGQKLGGPQEGEKPKDQDKTWEWMAANTDGMLDKTIFPFLRTKKSPALLVLWGERIDNEGTRAKRPGLNDKAAQFNQQTLPKLQWQRARDLVLLGKESEGFSTMLDILRQYANHAEFDQYAKELRKLLGGGEAKAPEQGE